MEEEDALLCEPLVPYGVGDDTTDAADAPFDPVFPPSPESSPPSSPRSPVMEQQPRDEFIPLAATPFEWESTATPDSIALLTKCVYAPTLYLIIQSGRSDYNNRRQQQENQTNDPVWADDPLWIASVLFHRSMYRHQEPIMTYNNTTVLLCASRMERVVHEVTGYCDHWRGYCAQGMTTLSCLTGMMCTSFTQAISLAPWTPNVQTLAIRSPECHRYTALTVPHWQPTITEHRHAAAVDVFVHSDELMNRMMQQLTQCSNVHLGSAQMSMMDASTYLSMLPTYVSVVQLFVTTWTQWQSFVSVLATKPSIRKMNIHCHEVLSNHHRARRKSFASLRGRAPRGRVRESMLGRRTRDGSIVQRHSLPPEEEEKWADMMFDDSMEAKWAEVVFDNIDKFVATIIQSCPFLDSLWLSCGSHQLVGRYRPSAYTRTLRAVQTSGRSHLKQLILPGLDVRALLTNPWSVLLRSPTGLENFGGHVSDMDRQPFPCRWLLRWYHPRYGFGYANEHSLQRHCARQDQAASSVVKEYFLHNQELRIRRTYAWMQAVLIYVSSAKDMRMHTLRRGLLSFSTLLQDMCNPSVNISIPAGNVVSPGEALHHATATQPRARRGAQDVDVVAFEESDYLSACCTM